MDMTDAHRPGSLAVDGVQDYVRNSFLRFYETSFALRDPGVRAERRRLLERAGTIFTDPYVELVPSYPPADETVEQLCAGIGVPEATGLFRAGLMPFERPYRHQVEAVRASMSGRDVVLSTGTGSGKTEA